MLGIFFWKYAALEMLKIGRHADRQMWVLKKCFKSCTIVFSSDCTNISNCWTLALESILSSQYAVPPVTAASKSSAVLDNRKKKLCQKISSSLFILTNFRVIFEFSRQIRCLHLFWFFLAPVTWSKFVNKNGGSTRCRCRRWTSAQWIGITAAQGQ